MASLELMEPVLGEVIIVQYDGEYDKKTGTYHGSGTAQLDNSSQYTGKFKHGLFHGKGRFTWPDGVVYEGDFEHGVMVGKGSYTWADGSTYSGDIRNGKREGVGKFVGSSKQVYEGGWRNGRRNGQGKIFYNLEKTVSYSGDWTDDLREGYGIMKYSSGGSYEGEWKADKKCGLGVMLWRETDEIYSGQWEDDYPHGSGEHIWGEGTMKGSMKKQMCNIYRGNFVRGQRDGYGAFFYMNGSQYTGGWSNNVKHGTGVYIYPDGKIFSGSFESNRMVFATDADAAANQKANDDISPQYSLNIDDIFDRYPKPSNVEPELSDEKQTKEIERLLLKYNESVRALYRRYAEHAVRLRQKEITAVQAATMFSSYEVNRVDRTIITARNIQKRLFCMSLDTMKRFLRELGLVSPTFRCYDIAQCLRRMRSNFNLKSFNCFYDYKRAIIHKECSQLARPRSPKTLSSSRPKSPSVQKLSENSVTTTNTALTNTNGSTIRRGQTPNTLPAATASSAANNEAAQKKKAARNAAANAEAQAFAEQEAFVQSYNLEVAVNEKMGKIDWSEVDLSVAPILDGYFDPRCDELDFDIAGNQPILEREYVELFVRCVAESFGRNGGAVGSMTLYHTTYRVLAEKVLPLAANADSQIPEFYKIFYSDSVQELLNAIDSKPAEEEKPALITTLERLWRKLSGDKLSSRAGKIYLKQVIDYLLSLRGSAFPDDTTVEALLEASGSAATLPTSTTKKDYSTFFSVLDFDDFVEVFFRAVGSDLWTLGAEDVSSPSDELKDNQSVEELPSSPVERLIRRLKNWNNSVVF